ncbi:MAG: hypothetical protein IIB19_06525 [Chloroflexi bacterium]|nr:hypothetical protein [Chloroflexota bacterium]
MTLAGYGAAFTAALAVAMALLFAGPAYETQAAASDVVVGPAPYPGGLVVPANGLNSIGVSVFVKDTDIIPAPGPGTGFVIMTIDGSSTGSALFVATLGSSVVMIDGQVGGPGAGDLSVLTGDGLIIVGVIGTGGAGTIVVNVRLVDGGDGLDVYVTGTFDTTDFLGSVTSRDGRVGLKWSL